MLEHSTFLDPFARAVKKGEAYDRTDDLDNQQFF